MNIFWLLVNDGPFFGCGGYILAGGGWWWMVVDDGEWWWVGHSLV